MDQFEYLDIKKLHCSQNQPRKFFDEAKLNELAASIKENGLVQPILVKKIEENYYEIIAGERRWRACKTLDIKSIPVVIKNDISSENSYIYAIIENLHRDDLNPIEEAMSYKSMVSDFGHTPEECAQKIGKSRSYIINSMRLLSLGERWQKALVAGEISAGHGRALLSISDEKRRDKAGEMILLKKLSVRQLEVLCKKLIAKPKETKFLGKLLDPDLEYLADHLRDYLRTKVKIYGDSSKGKIEISYFNGNELERIIKVMRQSD